MKKYLIPVCMVLAFALLLGLTLNLYKPIKRLTQKKVVNPENVLQSSDIKWCSYVTKDGIICERNKDGSWHIYGTSTQATNITLNMDSLPLESGKTYMLSSDSKNSGLQSFCLAVRISDGSICVGDVKVKSEKMLPSEIQYGAFTVGNKTCDLRLYIWSSGAVIDETIYPCLVEGTEPGDFYIYK